jgi:hypothetical protein
MNRVRLLALLLFGSTIPVFAGNPTAPSLTVEHKSGFTLDRQARNPFWPIGWKPVAIQTPQEGAVDVPASAFVVSSIAMGAGNRFAIINGKIMQEGQEFGLKMGGRVYQVMVETIQDGQVVLSQNGREITVPLTRR